MAKKNESEVRTVDGGVAVVAEPNVEAVIEPVIQTDAAVPAAEIVKTESVPLVEPTAIVSNLVYEQTAPVADGSLAAPQVLTTGSRGATRVEVVCDGVLGHRSLRRGDITDDAEYVALLKTQAGRGRQLVREVK